MEEVMLGLEGCVEGVEFMRWIGIDEQGSLEFVWWMDRHRRTRYRLVLEAMGPRSTGSSKWPLAFDCRRVA